MARIATQHRCVCEDCGTVFYANRSGARWHSAACKMRAYRRRKLEEAAAKKFQLDMETFALFQQVCDHTPALANLLGEYLKGHDQDSFKQVLYMLTVTQTGVTNELVRG